MYRQKNILKTHVLKNMRFRMFFLQLWASANIIIFVNIDIIMSADIIMSIILAVGMMMMFMISIINTILAFAQIPDYAL